MAQHTKAWTQNLKQTLSDLRAFAIEIAESASAQADSTPFRPSHMFSTAEYGGLALSGPEADRYGAITAKLLATMGDAMSERSITSLVQTALLKTLDLKHRQQSKSVSDRAVEAVKEVQLALESPRLTWVSCIPILGLTPPKRPWDFNNVALIDMKRKEGKAILRAADLITDQTTNTDDERAMMKADTRKELIDAHPGQAFALVTTLALDAGAAWASAKRRLRFTLDCLNLAIDFLHGNSKLYELSMEEPLRRHYASGMTVNVTDHTSTFSAPCSRVAPKASAR